MATSIPRQAVVPEEGRTDSELQSAFSRKRRSRPACVQRQRATRAGGETCTPCVEGGAAQLAHALRRVVRVLEHLDAEYEVEARILDRQALDRALEVGGGVLDHVDADVLARVRLEEGEVRLDAAPDVEHAVRA